MAKINAKLGTNYDLFNYYGAPDADRVIVAMGSICDVADAVSYTHLDVYKRQAYSPPSADASPRRNTKKFVGGSGLRCIGLQ